jgi:hypothetical protein
MKKNREGNGRRYPAGKPSTLPPDDVEGLASDLSALIEGVQAVGNRGGDLRRDGIERFEHCFLVVDDRHMIASRRFRSSRFGS